MMHLWQTLYYGELSRRPRNFERQSSAFRTGGDDREGVLKFVFFAAAWLSDKPGVQRDFFVRCALLHRRLRSHAQKVLFFKCFFRILTREWAALDRHRTNKFLLMLRIFFAEWISAVKTLGSESAVRASAASSARSACHLFLCCSKLPTPLYSCGECVAQFAAESSSLLADEVLLNPQARGIALHLVDVFVPELKEGFSAGIKEAADNAGADGPSSGFTENSSAVSLPPPAAPLVRSEAEGLGPLLETSPLSLRLWLVLSSGSATRLSSPPLCGPSCARPLYPKTASSPRVSTLRCVCASIFSSLEPCRQRGEELFLARRSLRVRELGKTKERFLRVRNVRRFCAPSPPQLGFFTWRQRPSLNSRRTGKWLLGLLKSVWQSRGLLRSSVQNAMQSSPSTEASWGFKADVCSSVRSENSRRLFDTFEVLKQRRRPGRGRC